MIKKLLTPSIFFLSTVVFAQGQKKKQSEELLKAPNVIIIYVDDLGYGDLSSYGATKIHTPNIDKLASQGIRFTNAHSSSATSTPSRYAMMTGVYPWRKGATVLPGDAALIVPTDRITLPGLFKKAGYETGIVGKWHLGLGEELEKNWNTDIKPGPNEVGFNYSFIFPATADRVPTVFMENGRVLALDEKDPMLVDYTKKVGNDPTGEEHPELLKMKASPNHGHNQTIINGIGRIGYMSGGNRARWVDEEVPLTFLYKAKQFINDHKSKPFFLYYALTEPHVPRMPSTIFKGKSQLGYRGDVILQLDWTVGEIMKQLDEYKLAENTIIIFSSDNGPVLNDGYEDEAVEKLNGHNPAGIYRGGKYSAFEGGTRVPFILHWAKAVKPGVSAALICQMDLLASFSSFLNEPIAKGQASDSENVLNALLGKSNSGRTVLVQQGGPLSIVKGDWKYISPSKGPSLNRLTQIETGNSPHPQLYNLKTDPSETTNLAEKNPAKVKELSSLLESVKNR